MLITEQITIQTKIDADLDAMLEEDLFILGNIHASDESLSFNDFDRIFRIIQKHAIKRLIFQQEVDSQERVNLLRKHGLGAAHNKAYRDLCHKSKNTEEQVFEQLTKYVCQQVGIEQEAFT